MPLFSARFRQHNGGMTWCFRLRFNLGEAVQLDYDHSEWQVSDGRSELVTMRPADGKDTIRDSRRLSVTGKGYGSERAAEDAGLKWQDWLILSFASANIGADFGDRAPFGIFTTHALRKMSEANNARILNDKHGLMTYQCDDNPMFISVGATSVTIGKQHEKIADALNRAMTSEARLNSRQRLAYDLYSASFSEANADARFMMLMMAVETLIEQEERSRTARNLIDTFISSIRESSLGVDEARSIIGSLGWLRLESINQAGKRLASQLGDREYQGEAPATFFNRCYILRSKLVHGEDPRPTRDEVGTRAARLEFFVSDLLGAPLT